MRSARSNSICLLVLLVTGTGTALGQGALDFDACEKARPDTRIVGCSRVLSDPSLPDDMRIKVLVHRGRAYLDRGKATAKIDDVNRAIVDFSSAIRLDQKNAESYVARYEAWGEKETLASDKDYSAEKLADLTGAIQAEPRNWRHYQRRAMHFWIYEKYKEAADDYSRIIGIMPENGAYYYFRAQSLAQLGKNEDAIADLRRALGMKGLNSSGTRDAEDLLRKLGGSL